MKILGCRGRILTDCAMYDEQNGKQGDVKSLAQANNEALAKAAEK